MQANEFENSRIAEGTMRPGAQHITNTPETPTDVPVHEDGKGFADTAHSDVPEKPARRVMGAGTLTGDRVRNKDGDDLGKIEEIMIDLTDGRVAYAVLSFGGFLGMGDKLFAIPWGAFTIDQKTHEFVLDVRRDELEKAPGFDKNHWPDMAALAYGNEIHRHYGQTPYWEIGITAVRRGPADGGDRRNQ